MILKTIDHSIFKFRKDNRENGVNERHLEVLVEKISKKNLLHLHPILVNSDFEIINGQHRLKAAEILNIPIFYQIMENFTPSDIINSNTAKVWGINDYLNFYCQNNYEEYLKLQDFIKKTRLNTKFCVSLLSGKNFKNFEDFRSGTFIFKETISENLCKNLKETCDIIRNINGAAHFLSTMKFQEACITLLKHPDFNFNHWKDRLNLLSKRIRICATCRDYIDLLSELYNYKLNHENRISFV